MAAEIWKDVKGYEGLYEVSDLGQVRNARTMLLLSVHERSKGRKYSSMSVGLFKNGKQRQVSMHRIIAFAFIENEDNKPFINHKDGNPRNNQLGNLEWCTAKENSQHASRSGLLRPMRGEDCGTSKLKERDVLRIKEMYKTKKYRQWELGKMFGVGQDQISRVISGDNWKYLLNN